MKVEFTVGLSAQKAISEVVKLPAGLTSEKINEAYLAWRERKLFCHWDFVDETVTNESMTNASNIRDSNADMKTNNQQNDKSLKHVLPVDGYTRIPQMAKIFGVHHITLRRWWQAGKFPKPKKLNGVLLFDNFEVLEYAEKHITKGS